MRAALAFPYRRFPSGQCRSGLQTSRSDLAGSGAWKALSAGELKTLMQPRLPAAAPEADNPYYAKLVFGSDAYIRNPEIQTEARKHYEALLDGCEQTKDTAARIMGDTVARWLKLN